MSWSLAERGVSWNLGVKKGKSHRGKVQWQGVVSGCSPYLKVKVSSSSLDESDSTSCRRLLVDMVSLYGEQSFQGGPQSQGVSGKRLYGAGHIQLRV